MKIAIVGKGKVGRTIGSKWSQAGHDVLFGVRNDDASGEGSFKPIGRAIRNSEVVLFAVPASAMDGIIDGYASDLDGKILIDATNNMRGPQMSSVDKLVSDSPSAKVFRAFNSLGWENFANPQFGDGRADLFYCGSNDAESIAAVEQLISDVGLRPIRVGNLDQVEVVDSVVRLWFALASGQGMGRHTAFKVLSD